MYRRNLGERRPPVRRLPDLPSAACAPRRRLPPRDDPRVRLRPDPRPSSCAPSRWTWRTSRSSTCCPEQEPVSWLRRGEGLVGWGVAARLETSGPTRFSDAVKWWSETVARAEVDDQVGEPGTGLVCFGAFAFADEPGDSVLVIPQVVVGRRGDRTWLTTVSVEAPVARARTARPTRPSASSSPTARATARSG